MLRRTVFALVSAVASLALFAAAASAENCSNEQLRRENNSTQLPDCRGYELVSPAQKAGYAVGLNVEPATELAVSTDGGTLTYTGANPLPGAAVGSLAGSLAARGPGAWATTSIFLPPGPNQTGDGFPSDDAWLRGSTPDQRTSVYYDATTVPFGSLWIRRADGSYQRIADASGPANTSPGANPGNPYFEGISSDGRHVVFGDTDRLLPGLPPPSEPENPNQILYEWVDDGSNGGAGTLRVVDQANAPLTLPSDQSAGLGGGPTDSGGRISGLQSIRHAISTDGSRIYFQDPAPSSVVTGFETAGGGALYLRTDGTTTVDVSAPTAGHAAATAVQFLDASADGSTAFFWANAQLTDSADPAGGIYRFDARTGGLTFLDTAPLLEFNGTPVAPMGLASDDGTRLYFQRGGDIYVNSDGNNRLVMANAEAVSVGLPSFRDDRLPSANVSTPDGRYLAFVAVSVSGQTQVYRYDDVSGGLQMLSTTLAGPDPSTYSSRGVVIGNVPGGYPRSLLTRFMSDDGQYVYFTTNASLVPGDNNGVEDAYEWHDGRVSLLGSGTNNDGSSFIGTDGTGANAFIVSDQPLAPQDGDSVYDIYDARIGGGFPVAPDTPPCSGDSCQGLPSDAPILPTAASIDFVGAGNLATSSTSSPTSSKAIASAPTTVKGPAFALHVKVPSNGRLSVSGTSVTTVRTTATRAGTYKLIVRLTARARKKLKQAKTLKVTVRATFAPASGKQSVSTLTVTLKA
jgi:hypothetical protein